MHVKDPDQHANECGIDAGEIRKGELRLVQLPVRHPSHDDPVNLVSNMRWGRVFGAPGRLKIPACAWFSAEQPSFNIFPMSW